MHRVATFLLLLGLLAGCAAPAAGPDAGERTFTDDLGRTVTLPGGPLRVAGLTDVVAALWNYDVAPVAAFGFTGVTADARFAGRTSPASPRWAAGTG